MAAEVSAPVCVHVRLRIARPRELRACAWRASGNKVQQGGGEGWRIHTCMAYLLKYPVAEAHGGIWIRARPAGGSAVIPRDIRNDVCQAACSANRRLRKCWPSVRALSARRREQEHRNRRPCDVHTYIVSCFYHFFFCVVSQWRAEITLRV